MKTADLNRTLNRLREVAVATPLLWGAEEVNPGGGIMLVSRKGGEWLVGGV